MSILFYSLIIHSNTKILQSNVMKPKKKVREVGMSVFEVGKYLSGPSKAVEDLLLTEILEGSSLDRYQELMSIVLHCRLLALRRKMGFNDMPALVVFDKIAAHMEVSKEEILAIKDVLKACRKVLLGSTSRDNHSVWVDIQLYETLHDGLYASWGGPRTQSGDK